MSATASAPVIVPVVSASAPVIAATPPATDDDAPVLPPGFVAIPQSDEVLCGGFRVQVLPDGAAFPRFVRVLGADGKKVYEAHGRSYRMDATSFMKADLSGNFCGDLTGDGVPEIVLTESTMGAHCCYTRYVVSLTSPPKRLLMWEKGDAGTEIMPVKARPGASFQLVDSAVVWPPFDGDKGDPVISYAGAPLVPVVFSFQRGEFQLTSLSFPEVYRTSRNAIRAACAKAPDDCFGELIEWIDGLAIGDWDSERMLIKDEDLRKSLDRNAPAMRKILAAQLGSEQRPGKTEPSP
ncbi:MAG: hypothetical protein ABI193_22405 [Minicystis sp.]